jgi:hypothetical protein
MTSSFFLVVGGGVTHTWIDNDDIEEPLEVGGGGSSPKWTSHSCLVPGSKRAFGASKPLLARASFLTWTKSLRPYEEERAEIGDDCIEEEEGEEQRRSRWGAGQGRRDDDEAVVLELEEASVVVRRRWWHSEEPEARPLLELGRQHDVTPKMSYFGMWLKLTKF